MRIRTDDEVYRVDGVWLGPPKATFPWRARYVAWGVGTAVFLLVLAVERRMNISFGFFSTGWAVVITIALTRIVCSRISHERPLGAVMVMWLRELTAPREKTAARGGAASAARIRVRARRPVRKRSRAQRSRAQQGRRGRQQAPPSRTVSRRAQSKEVRGVRSSARPR